MTGLWRLRVCGDFSSAHQLRHYEGKCENMHGHNFRVEVDVCGRNLDPKVEFLMDFKELKRLLNIVTEELDHKHLNELSAFANCNPSSERLAQYIFGRMKILLASHPVHLEQVMVSEKASSMAWYRES